MKQYMIYPVRAVEFDGDDGRGVEDLAALLREVPITLTDMRRICPYNLLTTSRMT